MASAIKYPVDDGSQVQWTVVGAANAAAAWKDASDSSYVTTDTDDRYHLVSIDPLDTNVATVESVTVTLRCASVSGESNIQAMTKFDGNPEYSNQITPAAGISNIASSELPCPDGLGWTPAKFNAAEFGVYSSGLAMEDIVTVYRLSVTASVTVAAAAPSGRPYYRIHLTKDIKPVRLHRKKGD